MFKIGIKTGSMTEEDYDIVISAIDLLREKMRAVVRPGVRDGLFLLFNLSFSDEETETRAEELLRDTIQSAFSNQLQEKVRIST